MASNKEFAQIILSSLCEQINVHVSKYMPMLTTKVRALILETFNNSHEAHELTDADSKLVAVLGLNRDTLAARINAIGSAIAEAARITHSPFHPGASGTIRGHVRVEILRSTYEEILGSAEAKVVYDGGIYNWADWMINQGDRVIISDKSVLWKPTVDLSAWSRSGHALMIPKTEKASTARVPPEFSGVPDDNAFLRIFTRNNSFQLNLDTLLQGVLV